MTADPGAVFDHHTAAFAPRSAQEWARARACPVLHSEAHGGFHVAARYEDVSRVAHEDDTFSSRFDATEGLEGIVIPPHPGEVQSIPIEVDPPELITYRRILNRHFTPRVIASWADRMERIVDEHLDRFLSTGRCDVMDDIAGPIPAIVIIDMLGLPRAGWEDLATVFHEINYLLPGDEGYEEMARGLLSIEGLITEAIQERLAEPRDDLISALAHAESDGRRFTVPEVMAMCTIILGGGIDTTTALIGHALLHLDEDRELRARLIADPGLVVPACEEYLRWSTPIQAHARTVTRDTELGGTPLSAGERILLGWRGANWDDTVFADPERVDIDRSPNRHVAFGLGAHRCLGSTLARAEFHITVRKVLEAMPDYRADRDGVELYANIGSINGIRKLPVTFTPPSRTPSRTGVTAR